MIKQQEEDNKIKIATSADELLAKSLFIDNSYNDLTTENKTAVGSINELKDTKQDKGDYALKSEIPTFDAQSIIKTSDGYFATALTKQGTNKYLTFDNIGNNESLTTTSHIIVNAINEINASSGNIPWIVGEYKWMPLGSASIMPTGWVKVKTPNETNNWTLATPGRSLNNVFAYYFRDFEDISDGSSMSKDGAYIQLRNGTANGMRVSDGIAGKDIKTISNMLVSSMLAELWQYQPELYAKNKKAELDLLKY